tara:strand:- start:1746 stop:2198 length:453 start_codon:yes stop_codon:yes gene_type:complete
VIFLEKKVFYRSGSFIHFSRPLTLNKEEALLIESEHKPALHIDIERIRVNNSNKPMGEEVGGVILFEKKEHDGIFSMAVEEGKGKEKEILPLKNGEWTTVPAFEFHNAFSLFGEQELEIVEPAATGALSILYDGKAKLDVEIVEKWKQEI